LSYTLRDLNNDAATIQLDLLPDIKIPARLPMHIADIVSPLIVYHDTLVEGMVLESAIDPSLLFLT
jgi:hypothetical protein